MPTALLVDDEPNLLHHLAHKLERAWPELTVVACARSGREALELAERHRPDIVFLDIRMPGLSGLQVAERLPQGSRVVFVTAYEDYAVQAFEAAAVDYLLKPVADGRLTATVRRLQDTGQPQPERVARLLTEMLDAAPKRHLTWIRAGRGDTVNLVPVSAVVYFQADHKYTAVRTAREEHLIRTSIAELEDQLDPERFWRIHRGVIVAADEIAGAQRDFRGRYALRLKSRPESLRVSQTYAHRFKQM